MNIVVINDLSLNVNLLRLKSVAAINKTFELIEWSLQNSLTKLELIWSETSLIFPISGLPFIFGVKTVDSMSWPNCFLKNFSETSLTEVFSSIRLYSNPLIISDSISSLLYALVKSLKKIP